MADVGDLVDTQHIQQHSDTFLGKKIILRDDPTRYFLATYPPHPIRDADARIRIAAAAR
ncbi:hypothetical protein [Nocardia sp. NPDC004604]|uniref:hypothetical protein n=1 Tax=Nocardia sp. NPDC004604 TaxID=3157013 RepID=UPI0033B8A911